MRSRRRSNRRIRSIRSGIRQIRRAGRSSRELSDNSMHTQLGKQARQALSTAQGSAEASLVPYNPRLLSRARTRLQLGDWEQLADLDAHELDHNPASAELRLLAAAGHLQRGGAQSMERARALLKSAIEAGMDRESVARILIGGASNTLGRIAALSERFDDNVMHHFRSAIAIAVSDEDPDLLLQPNASRQLVRLAHASGSVALFGMAQRTALNLPAGKPAQAAQEAATAQPDAEQTESNNETKPLNIPLELVIDGQRHCTQLVPSRRDAFVISGSELVYELPDKAYGHLVTSKDGNYWKPSDFHDVKLKPNRAYDLCGCIPTFYGQNPSIWIFEYANGKRIASTSFSTKGGTFNGHLRISANTEAVNFSIRLMGKGRLDIDGLQIQLRTGTDVEIAETLQSQLKKLGDNLESTLNKNQQALSRQNLFQLESFIRLQNYLGSNFVLPEMHGWAISPDFGVLLINLLEAKPYDAVIEFGSGVSTVIVARILQKQQQRTPDQKTIFVSLDHLEQYFNQTRQQLETASVLENVQLELTPLVKLQTKEQGAFQFYDSEQALKTAYAKLKNKRPRVLVLVDGPPAATGKLARYPALPSVMALLPDPARADFLLDDYRRQDEKDVVSAWESYLDKQQRPHSKNEYSEMEKHACVIKVEERE